MTTNQKIDYLFEKINWGKSNMDAQSIEIMNNLKSDIAQDDHKQFIKDVRTMRKWQKRFFDSGGTKEALTRSKELEGRVDRYLENLDNPSLFDHVHGK